MRWDDVNARARGLATHLLGRNRLLRLGEAGGWQGAALGAIEGGLPVEPAMTASAEEFDRAIGRVVADRLALLGRWLDERRPALALVYEDETRRSLRVLLRGAAAGVAPVVRLQSLNPTPELPARTLERLARADSPEGLVEMLLRIGHPAGRAFRGAGPPDRSSLLGLELALSRLFAVRVVRGSRRAGPVVRRFAALTIDLENAWSLLSAPDWVADLSVEAVFLAGGDVLGPATFADLARRRSPNEIAAGLEPVFRGSPLAAVFDDPAAPPATLERRAIVARLTWYRRLARRDPLGPGVLFSVIERIRAEAHDLRMVLGALALGRSTTSLDSSLVTAQ